MQLSSFITAEEALVLLDTLLRGQKLKDVQELVFRYSWQGWTYPKIAEYAGYDIGHIRDVGYELWQQLTQAFGEQVTKKNVQAVLRRQACQKQSFASQSVVVDYSGDRQTTETAKLSLNTNFNQTDRLAKNKRQYWTEAIDVSVFYGRNEEIALLERWIVKDCCRLVTLVGMGGIGKTALAAKLADRLQGEFEYLIWQSLRNAPPIEEVLVNLLQILSNHQGTNLPQAFDAQVSQLMEYLRSSRYLLVFDNADAVLASNTASKPPYSTWAGQYREGYEGYGELFRRVGSEYHLSCLVLTSREKPKTLTPLEGETLPVRTLPLSGLSVLEVREILKANRCFCKLENDWNRLTERYSGNPLELKIVSATVRDLFDGSITRFLEQGAVVFGDISTLLDEQFQRLSEIEKQVIDWLAINREWVSLAELRTDFFPNILHPKLLEALQSLGRRSLLERSAGLFTLQPVVMEYVTEHLIERICEEIATLKLTRFVSHALLKAQAKDYVRESQSRVILAPLAARLISNFRSKKHVEDQLSCLLTKLRTEYFTSAGYGGGNLINLLRQLKVDLSDYNFSHLTIWQAFLQNVNLHRVNFANADLANSVFTETLATPLAVAFSRDGQHIATGDLNGEVRLWRASDGRNLFTCKGHTSWVWSVAFSPDGQTLASSSDDKTVKLWDFNTGQCCQTLEGHTSQVWSVAFSPDGQTLASGSEDRTVRIWDSSTGRCLQILRGHDNWVRSVAFAPSADYANSLHGQILASGSDDQTIKLWNLKTGQCYQTLRGHTNPIWSVAFSPDGQTLVSGSSDQTVRLWHLRSGECLQVMQGHTNWVRSVAFSPDGRTLASGSEDQTIKIWNIYTSQCHQTLRGHTNWVRSVAFSPDGQTLASGSGDHTVKLWDVCKGRCHRTLKGYTNRVWSVAFNPNGKTLASGNDDCTVKLWNLRTGECQQTLEGHNNAVCAIAFSPNTQILASGSNDQTIKLWDLATGRCWQTLRGHTSRVWSVAFSSDGQVLASSSDDQTVKLWDIKTGQCYQTLQKHASWVCSVAFSPVSVTSEKTSQALASGSYDQTIKFWDLATGKCYQTLQGHTNWVWSIAFSPDGHTLASGSGDHTIKLWDIKTGKCYQTLLGHSSRIWSVAFSPVSAQLSSGIGSILASGSSDQTVKLWDLTTGKCYRTLLGHTNLVWSVAFSPDGRILASGSQDETIKLWDVETGQCLKTLKSIKPYESMNITNITGLTKAQKTTLKALGAVELN